VSWFDVHWKEGCDECLFLLAVCGDEQQNMHAT